MSTSYIKSVVLIVLIQPLIFGCFSDRLDYNSLKRFGIGCPSMDRCQGYRNDLTYLERSCECDFNCTAYKDCCIDAVPSHETLASRPAARTDITCLHYGSADHAGVYVVSKCSDSWRGPRKIKQKCTSSFHDFRDPLSAAPVTDVARKETYRNRACAECNYANLTSLKTFQLRLKCPGLEKLTKAQIMANLTYHSQRQLWGAYKLNRFGNGTEFVSCSIIFDVPAYLNHSVRFCRSNLISTCASDWTRPTVARQCEQYMAAVYSNTHGYRNPHCATCNHKTIDDVSCQKESNNLLGRKGVSPYPIMVDINFADGDLVGKRPVDTHKCPSGQVHDAFSKTCRQLVCALAGHFLVNGKCVKI